MKIASTLILMTVSSSSAHAALVDRFRCQMSFESLTAKHTSQSTETDLLVARSGPIEGDDLDGQLHPTSGLSFAQAHLQTQSGDGMLMAIDLEYWHSYVLGADGKPTQAGMKLCFAPAYGLKNGMEITGCSLPSVNPRDPLQGFEPVETRNGVPGFSSALLEEKVISAPEGTLRFHCSFVATLP